MGNSDEIQLRIDPVHSDLDEEISGLHRQVTQLKNVSSFAFCKLNFFLGFCVFLSLIKILFSIQYLSLALWIFSSFI